MKTISVNHAHTLFILAYMNRKHNGIIPFINCYKSKESLNDWIKSVSSQPDANRYFPCLASFGDNCFGVLIPEKNVLLK